MTLISAEPDALPLSPLPAPTGTRYRPLRAGLLNIWEYDDQEFWFEDGRLILRGGNEAGKSKALEVLLPFLLDADLRPSRLDPFGERAKTMHWNLVGFQEKPKRTIGYTWLELGHLDPSGRGEPRFVTIGAGMLATPGSKRVQSWFFITHLRPGETLAFQEGGVPLTRKLLAERLGENGRVFEQAADYRAAVDRELYGLGEERYAALVHLMLRLRRPHLSAKLDPASLSALLGESLPPLDAGKVERLAKAFESLEEDARVIEEIAASHALLGGFLESYTTYARQTARVRAGKVRSAFTKFDGVTRRVREATQEKVAAEQLLTELEEQRAEADRESAELGGVLRALELSDEMRAADRLDALERQASHDAAFAEKEQERAEELTAELARREEAAEQAANDARLADREVDHASDAAATRARTAGMIDRHDVHAPVFRTDPRTARLALDAAISSRLADVKRLRKLERVLAEAEAALAAAQSRMEDAVDREDLAGEKVEAAKAVLAAAEKDFAAAVQDWVEALPVEKPEDTADTLFADAMLRMEEGAHCRALAEELLRPDIRSEEEKVADRRLQRKDAERRRAELTAERESVLAAKEEGPAPRPGRAPDRESLPGDALWKLSDFAPSLSADDRANLEAALEASGLLDARILPDGRLLDPDTLDVVIQGDVVIEGGAIKDGPRAEGTTLADLLVPVPSEELDEAAIRNALALVSVAPAEAPEPAEPAWIRLDGSWRVGPLRGRWSKEVAEHIGAGAREEARRRRLATLDDLLESVGREISTLDQEIDRLEAFVAALREAIESFPSEARMLNARSTLLAAKGVLAGARQERAKADSACLAAREKRNGAGSVLSREADQAGLLDRLGALEELREELGVYGSALTRLESTAQLALRSRRTADERREASLETGRKKAEQEERVLEASGKAAGSRAEADELAEREGKTVAEVLRRRDEARGRLTALKQSIRANENERVAASKREGVAEQALAVAEEERLRSENERERAVASLGRLAETDLLDLALRATDQTPAPSGLTAALELARKIEALTSDEAIGRDDLDRGENLTSEGVRSLQSQLPAEFRPESSRVDGLLVVTVEHLGRLCRTAELEATLGTELETRRNLLDEKEREVIEKHLIAELGHHLQERIAAGRRLVEEMNAELTRHKTNSGARIRLLWLPAEDSADGVKPAVEVLRKDVRLLGEEEQASLVRFLKERIREGRESEDVGSAAERVGRALDYRDWHEFRIEVEQDGARQRLSRRLHATGSGGSRAVLVHLPLFAAASAHYRSAKPEAPHLVLLDEAFAGIDADQRGSLMGLLVAFDLDFMMTNHEEWGCYAELPSVATYHLRRDPGRRGVAAVRFVWNGRERIEDDPPLRAKTAEFEW